MKELKEAIKTYFRNVYVSILVLMYDAIFLPLDEINNKENNNKDIQL